MEITNITAQEIIILSELTTLAKEAFEASALIEEACDSIFEIYENEICLFHSSLLSCDCYPTKSGDFVYRNMYLQDMNYKFSCDAESIYKVLKSCYLHRNNLEQKLNEDFDCPIDCIDNFFRKSMNKLRRITP